MKKFKYVISFIIPVAIFCLALLINNIAPLGKYIITIYDSHVQYPPFFLALKDFHFYLFNIGFGINFLGTVTYYLMSPLNLLIHFFDLKSYNTFYFLLIILKIGFSGLTMQYFLSHEEKHDNLWSTIFSIIYALIGFASTYYYNTFWMDSVIMLPLVLVGINKIIDNKSPLFYIVSLAITIILSFYTGYMCCIFSVIYFIYKLVETNKYKDKKIIKTFIISSLLVGLISAIVILPSYFALSLGKARGYHDKFTTYFKFNDNLKYMLYPFTPGNFQAKQVHNDGFAQVFCTLFVLCLFILSFFNMKISKKTKITTIVIILFYLLSFNFNLLDYAWQFFQKPVWWQHRYSFTLSLFMIIIAYKCLMNFPNLKITNINKAIIYLILAILILGGFIIFYHDLQNKNVYRIFVIGFCLILLINYLFAFNTQGKYKYIIIFLIIFELGLNCYTNVKESNNKILLENDLKIQQQTQENLAKIKDKNLYRLEFTTKDIYNKALMYDVNGINYFNSVRNQKVVNLMEYYFNFTVDSHCSFVLYRYDPYLLSLFNIKYIITEDNISYYHRLSDKIYVNDYPLGYGFMVSKDLLNVKLEKNKYFKNITNIYRKMLNQELTLYHKVKDAKLTLENAYYDNTKKQYIKIDDNKDAKVILQFKALEDILVIVDNNETSNKTYINNQEITKDSLYTNEYYPYAKKDDMIKIEIPLQSYETKESVTNVHYIKEQEYLNIMNQFKNPTFTNLKLNKKHTFEGTIDVKEDNLLFTSIAYEKGMLIKVNGKEVKPEIIMNSFVGLNLKKGKNTITIDYIPQGLNIGIICFILGIGLTIIYLKKRN